MLKEFDFFTSHPKDAGKSLFEAIAGLDKCAKRLHLPLQSGSDRVLEMMNRGYTVKDYLELADSYRRIVKNGLLTTDIIVGFPGETGKDFESTCALLNKVGFNAAYIFKYSPRPGTKAAEKEETLSRKAKEERHEKILDLQRRISRRLNNKNANIKN
jgi:tRNA-2-methylthio-N6-dimethylallyladenosine synthase